jgi:hypothetical protein
MFKIKYLYDIGVSRNLSGSSDVCAAKVWVSTAPTQQTLPEVIE